MTRQWAETTFILVRPRELFIATHRGGMKGTSAGAAGRGGMRLHAAATATASAAAGARGHLVQKSTTHPSSASRTSLGSRPLTAGTVRQQDHWLADFWPRHSSLHAVVAAHATAVREVPTAAEPSAPKTSRSPRQSFDRQRDLPLPDEPTTPAQQREGPFLDGALRSIDSADSDATHAAEPAEAAAAAETVAQTAAVQASQPAAAPDAQQQQQQQPSSPTSDAASAASASSADSFSRQAPGNVVATILVPRALSGWLIGPNGATAQQHQVPGARWFFGDAKLVLGGQQGLRMLHIQGPPDRAAAAVQELYGLLMADGAPRNVAFFRTKGGQHKTKLIVQTWLVGSIVGRNGQRIREAQERTGCRMQIVPLETGLKHGIKGQTGEREPLNGPMAVLEAAAESVDSLVAGLQTVFESIVANPKYKPFVMKELPLANRQGSGSGSSRSSSSGSSSPGGVARAA